MIPFQDISGVQAWMAEGVTKRLACLGSSPHVPSQAFGVCGVPS